MNKSFYKYFIIGLFALTISCNQKDATKDNNTTKEKSQSIYYNQEVEKKIDDLLKTMTLEEKAGQMAQVTLDVISKGEFFDAEKPHEIDEDRLHEAVVKYGVGSILNTGQYTLRAEQWQNTITRIQEKSQETRLKIPVLYGVDAIHGVNYTVGGTLFPQQLALAATFNTEYARMCGEVTAYELRASSIPWNFSPVLDLGRQPLWSRHFETFGEDPYLVTQMGNAIVDGYQGTPDENGVIDKQHVAACLKHFLGYSNSKTGRDRTPIQMSEREMREYYLVPFKEAIERGAQTIMINSTEINGTPVHADKHILTTILKEELGFDGLAVTDWEDIIMLHSVHKVAKDEKEAVKIAINAGVDMSMIPMKLDFVDYLVELVREGEVPVERVDDAVRRILRVKFRLDLFNTPTTPLENYPDFSSDKFASYALASALESVTLLKNKDQILPLSKDKKVLFCGVGANSLNALNGAWTHTWQGVSDRYNTKGKPTIYEAAQALIGDKAFYAEGTSYEDPIDIQATVNKAKNVDVVVVCLGEQPATEISGNIVDLNLPKAQKDLVNALAKTGKPIVAVLLHSRPRVISDIEPHFSAVFEAYWPGDEGGKAIVATLFGDNNPSGKLPFTYPRYVNDLVTYDHKFSETKDPDFGFTAFNPQWQFGDGLSYTTFEYSDIEVEKAIFSSNDPLKISVTVTNTGNREGKETVMLFTRDHFASITPSIKRLRKFEKITLLPGESRKVEFTLTSENVAFMNHNLEWITEPGEFDLLIGGNKKEVVFIQ